MAKKRVKIDAGKLMYELIKRTTAALAVTMMDEADLMTSWDDEDEFTYETDPLLTVTGPKDAMDTYVERVVNRVLNTPINKILDEANQKNLDDAYSSFPSYEDFLEEGEDNAD